MRSFGRRGFVGSVVCLALSFWAAVYSTRRRTGAWQITNASPHPTVNVQLTEDFLTFFKFAIAAGGVFIAILAFIGVAFFGFDVRKARASMDTAQAGIQKLLTEAQGLLGEIQKGHACA